MNGCKKQLAVRDAFALTAYSSKSQKVGCLNFLKTNPSNATAIDIGLLINEQNSF